MADDTLADLPEAIPLQRVSPVWRWLAVLGGVTVVMLIGGILALSVALASARSRAAVAGLTPPPGAFVVNTAPLNDDPDPAPANAVNLPYPVQDDLNWRNQRVEKPEAQTNPARQAFQRLGAEVWKAPSEASYAELVVAPDGAQVAFFQGNQLVVGPFARPEKVELAVQQQQRRWRGQPAPAQNGPVPTGAPAWSADSSKVYFACEDGLLRCYTLATQNLDVLPWRGDSPVAVGANQLVFFRSQPAPVVDAPGAAAGGDPVEIVVADLGPKTLRIVRPAKAVQYAHPAAAPDGKRLAVWTSTTPVDVWPKVHQLELIDLADGSSQRIGTVTTDRPGPIAWTPDGAALVYQRDLAAPLPPDYLATPPLDARFRDAGLFYCTIKDGAETRLNRGGGCGLATVTPDGQVMFFVAPPPMAWRNPPRLRQASLQAVRDFAARTPAPAPRTAAAWSTLLQQVCTEANVPADASKARMTPELMAQMAERFKAAYRGRFQEEAADGLEGFDRQTRETNLLELDGADRRRLDLVLGAVRGEHLRTQHGAIWQLSETPGKRVGRREAPEQNPFAVVVEFARLNDAGGADDDDEDERRFAVPALEQILHDAAGRPLLLTNDPPAARAAVATMADPDLERGRELLEKGQPDAGEKVLAAMAARPAHAKNDYLALLVGRLLYEHHRLKVADKFMTLACGRGFADARKFNLLGLAQLEQEPRQAQQAFKKALRCDLHYGPAWLNLAQAYCQAGDTPSAVACLRRFVEMADYSPLAADARRPLAVLEAK